MQINQSIKIITSILKKNSKLTTFIKLPILSVRTTVGLIDDFDSNHSLSPLMITKSLLVIMKPTNVKRFTSEKINEYDHQLIKTNFQSCVHKVTLAFLLTNRN